MHTPADKVLHKKNMGPIFFCHPSYCKHRYWAPAQVAPFPTAYLDSSRSTHVLHTSILIHVSSKRGEENRLPSRLLGANGPANSVPLWHPILAPSAQDTRSAQGMGRSIVHVCASATVMNSFSHHQSGWWCGEATLFPEFPEGPEGVSC